MEKTQQFIRKRQKQKEMPPVDRLSALPDDILCHILSYLPTKLSVSISVLGRRWRSLWTYVPNLDLDSEMTYPKDITRVLSLHKVPNLNTFRLHYDESDCTSDELMTWMTTVIARNVRNMDFHLDTDFMFCPTEFTYKSLVTLRLSCYVLFTEAPDVPLPCLKKLHLCCLYEPSDEGLPCLLSACPVLEELIIERNLDDWLYFCNIVSPTIKMLTFDFPFNHDLGHLGGGFKFRLEINAPLLRYLHLRDCVSNSISAQMLTSLIDADICLDYYMEVEDDDDYFVSVLKFVDSLYNVKVLKLSSCKTFPVGVFADYQRKSAVRFENLVTLELGADWLFLKKFLEVADNLEVLIIRQVKRHLKHWRAPEEVPVCLLSRLRTIRIEQLGCMVREFKMVAYFLRNAKVLQRAEVYYRDRISSKARFNAHHRVSMFERASEACELVLF